MSTVLLTVVFILCLGGSGGGYYGQGGLIFIGIVFVAALVPVLWWLGSKPRAHDIC